MITIGIIFGTYVLGAILVAALDGWFDWSGNDGEALAFMCLFWPISCWFIIAETLRNTMKNAKDKKLEREAQAKRLRIATLKELEELEKELESDISKPYKRAG